MNIRKILVVGILAAAATVIGGCGKKTVVWDCSCTIECDGQKKTVHEKECASEEGAQKAVDEAVNECHKEGSKGCSAGGCSCECKPTSESCTPK